LGENSLAPLSTITAYIACTRKTFDHNVCEPTIEHGMRRNMYYTTETSKIFDQALKSIRVFNTTISTTIYWYCDVEPYWRHNILSTWTTHELQLIGRGQYLYLFTGLYTARYYYDDRRSFAWHLKTWNYWGITVLCLGAIELFAFVFHTIVSLVLYLKLLSNSICYYRAVMPGLILKSVKTI